MSQFMPEKREQGGADSKGPESHLSNDERKALQRALSFPEDLPPRFKSWILEHVVTNIQDLPVSQLSGFRQIDQVEVSTATTGVVGVSQTRNSSSYGDLATVGPSLSELRDGLYFILFGAAVAWDPSNAGAWMSLAVNGASASDLDACVTSTTGGISITRGVVKTLANSDANSIVAKYRSQAGGNCNYQHRWLIAQRIGPVPS